MVHNRTKAVLLKRGLIHILISRKVDYGLRCLIYLAGLKTKERVSIRDLSKRLRVSYVFLAKIMQILVRAGIVESRRGKVGGVRLKDRKAKLYKIITLMDPAFSLNRCLNKEFSCFLKNKCPLRRLLATLEKDLFAKLEKISLLELTKESPSPFKFRRTRR